LEDAELLGINLAKENFTIVYGGYQGNVYTFKIKGGSMGKLASGALENNGKVIGVYPKIFSK
jgi:predicted Rossmann-fold nucleotide-binding protein